MPTFNEKDRLLFLDICGVRQLSQCVKREPQTESWRPCPPMQAMVRSVIPYIQRFLRHHDEMDEVYSELINSNIADKIKHLSFGQVRKSPWEKWCGDVHRVLFKSIQVDDSGNTSDPDHTQHLALLKS